MASARFYVLENLFHFQERRALSAEPSQEAIGTTYAGRSPRRFTKKSSGRTAALFPVDLKAADDRDRPSRCSLDSAYRKKWKMVVAQMRKSRAIPKKNIKAASARWFAGSSREVSARSAGDEGGGATPVPFRRGRRDEWFQQARGHAFAGTDAAPHILVRTRRTIE